MMPVLSIESSLLNGDCGLILGFVAAEHRLIGIHAFTHDLLAKPLFQMINVIPGANHLVLIFSAPITDLNALLMEIKKRLEIFNANFDAEILSPTTHVINVCYHRDVAADLSAVCKRLDLSVDDLIQLHTAVIYRVQMLGFLPGFTYLSANDELLNLPRKPTPNLKVPAGSIAIAGSQTGIYNNASPGGWHVIGQTTHQLLDWTNPTEPMKLKPMDQIRFRSISVMDFTAKTKHEH